MRSFKSLSLKEKLEYIGIMAIYPLILLFEQMGKSVKFLNSRSRQITASILTVCLMLTMIPVMSLTAFAATTATAGAFTVTDGVDGTEYTYADGVLTVLNGAELTIANTNPNEATTTDRIEVAKDASANITLAGVNIDVSGTEGAAAFKIADNSTGNVTITLANGTTNTLKSGWDCAGLQKNGDYISETQGKLTITGTGTLNATGGVGGAGIGGGYYGTGSNITISGGTIIASGGTEAMGINGGDGAGIGGGMYGAGSHITISGGTVTAISGEYGAGIGGGLEGTGSNITISGGSVTAIGVASDHGSGAGIGGGLWATGSNITISGGTVTARGDGSGAGIGGGGYSTCSNITITSGTVTAKGGWLGAGIGGGECGAGSNITISGGTVTATGGEYGSGIGGGFDGAGSNITISGGTVTATGGYESAGIGGGFESAGSNITISGGTVTATGGQYGAGIGGGGLNAGSDIVISGGSVKAVAGEDCANAIGGGIEKPAVTPTDGNENNVYLLTGSANGQATVTIDGKEYTTIDGNYYVYLPSGLHTVTVGDTTTIYYIKDDGTLGDPVTCGAFIVTGGTKGTDYTYENNVLTIKTATALAIANVNPNTATTDRIEVAKDASANITLAGVNIDVSGTNNTAAFKIADNSTGNVTITLADSTTNTLKSGQACAGLQKNGDTTTGKLTITGTGTLTAIGYYGAGIGGGDYGAGSNITISGGTVTAAGGDYGAGIGGGLGGTGSDITISGGTVTAAGGGNGAGIGGGHYSTGSNITISGGSVKATGGLGAAGIGGGYGGAGSNIVINGGSVKATGGYNSAGIGGSDTKSGSNITISGGTVTAAGGDYGAGIGGGASGAGSYITISGGTVTAKGGDYGAGIGGGCNGAGSNITISDGSVKAVAGENCANAIGGGDRKSAVTPTDGADNVYLLIIENTNGEKIYIDGTEYTPNKHDTENKVYAYLKGIDHTVKVGENTTNYVFDANDNTFKLLITEDDVIINPTSFVYNGSEQKPTVTVTVGGTTLTENTDYTVAYSDNTDAGKGKVTVTGKGSYIGTVNKEFDITKATNEWKVNPAIEGWTYGETAKTPTGMAKFDEGDYGIAYYDKDKNLIGTPSDAGNYFAKIFVSKTDNFSGLESDYLPFTIKKAPLTITAKDNTITYGDAPTNNGVTYSGFVNSEEANVLDGTLDYDYSYAQYGNVGDTYTITPKGLTAANYEITFKAGKLTVNPLEAEIEWSTLSEGDLVYDGNANTLTATVKNKKNNDNVAFEIELSGDNKNVTADGFYYTVTGLTGDKAGNYKLGSALQSPTYKVTKADPTVTWPNNLVGNAGDKLSTVALENGFTWDNGDTVIVYSDNNYGMTYTPADTNNYNILKKDIKVNGLDVTFPTGEITLKDNKWTEFWNNLTFGLFFKETQSITITAADTESGVKEIAYYLSTEELSVEDVKALENSKWSVYADAFNVEPDNKYVVYARITDNAGNIIYINSDGIVLDSIKPIIAGIEDGKDVYGDATFTVDEEYLDTVTLDGEPIEAKDGKYSVPADNKEHTIVVTDKTGNQVTYKLTVYKNYKVSFVVDGKEISSSEVGYGKDATLPEIPAKDGYTAAWDVDGKNITSDTVITAVYEKIPQSPQTGDNTNIWMWVALLFVSGIFVFGIGFAKKRKEQEAE